MNVPVRVTKEQVIAIHDVAITQFGGLGGIRDEGLLESALAQPWQSFSGEDLYPSAIEKACRLAYGIICTHPFVDGNKRTGAALLGACLRMSGVDFLPRSKDFLETVLAVADGAMSYDNFVKWVCSIVH